MIWSDIYKELSARILNMRQMIDSLDELSPELAEELETVPEIRYIDLWHEQAEYLAEELPFPTPAVFIAFNTLETADIGALAQDILLQVDLYIFWETFTDTYDGAIMQTEALDYLNLMTVLNVLLHGYTGNKFSTMRKTGFQRMDSGGAGNLYRASFECTVRDYSAQELVVITDMLNKDIVISPKGTTLERSEDEGNLYDI